MPKSNESWIESCRRDLLDHVIARNERHIKRHLSEHIRYCHQDRTHLAFAKQTPAGRVQSIQALAARLVCDGEEPGSETRAPFFQ